MKIPLICDYLKFRKAIREVFLVSESLLEKLRSELNSEFIVHGGVNTGFLNGLFYRSPMYNELALPFVPANFVSNKMGTGLVHCSYAHGFDDYKVYFFLLLTNLLILIK